MSARRPPHRERGVRDLVQRALLLSTCASGVAALIVAVASPAGCSSSAPAAISEAGFDGSADADDAGTLGDATTPPDSATFDADPGDACGIRLTGIIRDFMDSHPDFEKEIKSDPGIVLPDLGADFKPVYALEDGGTLTTHGRASFDQWYRDVPGTNQPFEFTLLLSRQVNGINTYDNPRFFPIDDRGFGNQGRDHNYHFTYELHTTFTYTGGEIFTFIGDDDVFAYVNGKRAIDLGGVHNAQNGTIDLDKEASKLGLVKGQPYPLSVFQAERHTIESTFRIDTSVVFTNCTPIFH